MMLPQLGISGGTPAPRKRKTSLDQHRGGANISRLHDQRRQCVRQDMAHQKLGVARTARNRALDIRLTADRKHDRTDHPDDARHFGDHDRDDHDPQARPRQRDQRDGEQDRRDRHDAVHHAHDDGVNAPEIATEQPDAEPDQACERGNRKPDDQRDTSAMDGARKNITAELIGAEPEPLRWRDEAD